jgi:hypothetical protein
MTRGRRPQKAIDVALPLAQKRGEVFPVFREKEYAADLVIVSEAWIIFVRVKRTRRLHCSIAEIENQFSETIAILRSLLQREDLIRELWICSTHERWRFFQVEPDRLVEINHEGNPVKNKEPGAAGSAGITPIKNEGEKKGEPMAG